jgi:hypothetical protein
MPNRYICTKCGELKPLSSFVKSASRPCGRISVCKECQNRSLREDIQLRLSSALRLRMRQALRGETKARKRLVGCSTSQLLSHLEGQFKKGMNWENYGQWEIDHIIPCSAFDLSDPEQQAICFHYSNLQPMWSSANRSKGKKWNKQFRLVM